MSIPTAVAQLLEVEEKRGTGTLKGDETLAIALSRVGGYTEERIVCGTLRQLAEQPAEAFGAPLHSLVIVGRRVHHLEIEYAAAFAVDPSVWKEVAEKAYGCRMD